MLRRPRARRLAERIGEEELHVPAHFDAEVLSALGRLSRAREIPESEASQALARCPTDLIERHAVANLLLGAWSRRGHLRLVDALYIELASQLGTVVITTDQRLAQATPLAEVIS